jgi:2-desacetyl-2-hydroxyethyl bacteriochlorophyllide A dehydrogenase
MLAAYCTGKEAIEVRETPDPSPPPGEVLIRVRSCGICGSDLHFYHGDFPASPNTSPGHELSGEIAALGEGVTGWEVGQRVAVEPLRRCDECVYCRTGRYHLCPKRILTGSYHDGGLAEYFNFPAYGLYELPESMEFETGALAEPLAVSVHGLHIVNLTAGEKVLVLGSGTIGVMAVLAASVSGASVVATYRHDHQAQAAREAGASSVVKDTERSGLEKEGFDVVVETIGGSAPTLGQALGIVRSGGRVSVLGVFSQPSQIHALGLVLKEISVVGGITYCRPGVHSDFDTALGMLANHGDRLRSLITHRFSLADAAAAYATAADKSTRSLKVHVNP